MKHGVDFPPFEEFADPRFMAEMAYEAEQAGWDGVFMWDHVWLGMREPFIDPWVALSAIAMRTERVRIGAMVTPLARRRPWMVARATVSLDHLSNGRLIFGAGLGSPADTEFGAFGEETDNRVRARKLDEGLDVLAGLWSGEPFSYEGQEYRIDDVTFRPKPVQQPRIPVWVGGQWPNRAPFRRAARWDGAFPTANDGNTPITPDILREIDNYVKERRTSDGPFDLVAGAENPMDDPSELADRVSALEEAGLTWAIYSFGSWNGTMEGTRERVRQGPPR